LALAGQPNVGKSTLFNLLTGLSQHVGNWPGKTVERKDGVFCRGETRLNIVDLPGTYSLTANSEEERIARDFILKEHPDVVVMVADASALERNLYLLAELLVLPAPVVLALNMMDIAEQNGARVDPDVLEAALGFPVVPIVATKNQGLEELVNVAERVAQNPNVFHPRRPAIGEGHYEVFKDVRKLVSGQVPDPYTEDWVALKLLEGDTELTEYTKSWLPQDSWNRIHAVLREHEDAILDIASGRYRWIGRMVRAAVSRPRIGQVSLTDRLDKMAVHPLWGIVLLFAVFGLLFWVTYTVAGPIQGWLDEKIIGGMSAWVRHTLVGAPPWISHLITDGVLGGAGIVLTFLPILMLFFAGLGVMEDTGYLARVAYVMDRFMHHLGLHGKSILPLCMGFGCNVPAVVGTRVIESRSGRILTVLLAPLVPCTARLAVVAFLTPAFFGGAATLVSWSLVAFNIIVLVLVGAIMNCTLFRGQQTAFIMELPLYHMPNLRTIAGFMWKNIWEFVRKAGTVILIVSLLVWALSTFPGPNMESSYLARFARMAAPLGDLMGMNWRLLVALLSGLIAKENTIATLGVLYGTGGEFGLAEKVASTVSPATGLSFLVVTMLFIPCVATMAAIRQETRSWGWTAFSVALLLVLALLAGIGLYQCASWLEVGV
jgi:ferrous iron transport protein B